MTKVVKPTRYFDDATRLGLVEDTVDSHDERLEELEEVGNFLAVSVDDQDTQLMELEDTVEFVMDAVHAQDEELDVVDARLTELEDTVEHLRAVLTSVGYRNV